MARADWIEPPVREGECANLSGREAPTDCEELGGAALYTKDGSALAVDVWIGWEERCSKGTRTACCLLLSASCRTVGAGGSWMVSDHLKLALILGTRNSFLVRKISS